MTQDYYDRDWLNRHNLINPAIDPDFLSCQDQDLYKKLYTKFVEEYTGEHYEFFVSFRHWLIDNYRCYSDGTHKLYFKNEQDMLYCRLKL